MRVALGVRLTEAGEDVEDPVVDPPARASERQRKVAGRGRLGMSVHGGRQGSSDVDWTWAVRALGFEGAGVSEKGSSRVVKRDGLHRTSDRAPLQGRDI